MKAFLEIFAFLIRFFKKASYDAALKEIDENPQDSVGIDPIHKTEQCKNPVTDMWVLKDVKTGRIISNQKEVYENVPIGEVHIDPKPDPDE